jgi:hypothetical protein
MDPDHFIAALIDTGQKQQRAKLKNTKEDIAPQEQQE